MLRVKTFGGLWVENPGADSEPGPRPRPLALLAMLAFAGAKGMSRDRVLGVLWPESDGERARHALSQTIYSLRRDLGVEVVLSTPDLKLDAGVISSDVAEFRAAIREKKWMDAAALYVGPFLEGFYLADALEFERWAESERASLAADGARAIQFAAKQSAESGRLEESAELWRRLTRLEPVNARIALAYMEALAALGDRAAALAHGKAHADLLRREFDAEASQDIQRLMLYLRKATEEAAAMASGQSVRGVGFSSTEDARPSRIAPDRTAPRRRAKLRPRTVWFAAGAVGVVALTAIAGWRSAIAARVTRPILAVGRIRDLSTVDSGGLGTVLSEMLATSLGRINDLQVIANSRMLELTPRASDTSRSRVTDAARRAGATEMIEGELIPLSDGQLRLEVRRVDIDRGLVRSGYRIVGTDRIALFDSVTSLIAADLRVERPSGSLAEVSTRSPVAYRFYEEGLRAFFQFDAGAANRLFRAAIREDSTFAMATYYAWRSAVALALPEQDALSERAVALASHASPHDRLLIVTHVGYTRGDLRAVAAADTLATRYPGDPEALIRAAEVTWDLARVTELLNRSISLDSAAGIDSAAVCRLCDALNLLDVRYDWADSSDAVMRTLGRWRALRPHDSAPWALLAEHFVAAGQRTQAEIALRRYEALGGSRTGTHLHDLVRALRLDDFDAADTQCSEGLASRDTTEFLQFRWYCIIALRMEGRYADALALAREGRVPGSGNIRHELGHDRLYDAILAMEMGRPLAAADEFLALDRGDQSRVPEGIRARNRTWILTLAATAAVAGGDTLRARRMVDSIESVGRRSLFGRDPLLHHFVRGLLESRAGHHDAAVREFRAAMHSPTYGYTRINYELGKSLLALRRPAEAINVVQASLRGGIEGANLYVTRTEIHELLAQLFDANNQLDSAATHYATVERAWRSADPFIAPRREAARQWLATASSRARGSR